MEQSEGAIIDSRHPTDFERRLKNDAVKKPDGIQGERISVMLLDVVRRQGERLDQLEREITDFKKSRVNK